MTATLLATSSSLQLKPPRRWFRYSLRSLLIFTTFAAAGLGYLGYEARRAQRQRHVAERLNRLGGACFYEPRVFWNTVGDMPQWIQPLADRYPNLVCDLTSLTMRFHCSENEKPYCGENEKPSDEELKWLAECSTLKHVFIHGDCVSDVWLDRWERLQKLEEIDLSDTHIGDVGLGHLAGLNNLKRISLSSTEVTDAGMASLSKLTNLREINLVHTRVTPDGIRQLLLALPQCKVLFFEFKAETDPDFIHAYVERGIRVRSVQAYNERWAFLALGGLPLRSTGGRADTRIAITAIEEKATIDVTSPTGIDHATIERTGDQWPKQVIVQLQLTGLESFEAANGATTLIASVPSTGGHEPRAATKTSGVETPLDKSSPWWPAVRVVGGNGTIPLKEGHFEVTLPDKLFEGNPKSITLSWIDFYR
ncbi:MAG: leucine-rich repeat domain-containing protein [Planctomycetia bacterium]|nr:leucine-rich repeat domain-containing protein [Planctomycetia bacterium]